MVSTITKKPYLVDLIFLLASTTRACKKLAMKDTVIMTRTVGDRSFST